MRIDKYLKVSRLIKRRTVAKEVADHERIWVNGKIVKSSYQVKLNDEIAIRYGNRLITVKVTSILDSTKKTDAETMYELLKEEKVENTTSV